MDNYYFFLLILTNGLLSGSMTLLIRDSISGPLCLFTLGVNRLMVIGNWKFTMKADIWVSLSYNSFINYTNPTKKQ